MTLARLLGGNYPYITNVPVYENAAVMVAGELVMEHSTMPAGATKYYITAYSSGATTEATDALGVLQAGSVAAQASKENAEFYNINSDTFPDITATAGLNFLPCIVNPHATYFAFIDQADAVSCSTAISASATWTITSIEDDIDAGWLFTTDVTDSAATHAGKLRYIKASTSAAVTLITTSTITVDTSTDFVKMFPIGHDSVGLNAEATGITCGGTGTPAAGAASTTDIKAFEQWITHSGAPKHKMRLWTDDNLEGLDNVILEQEIIMFVHALRKE